MNQNRFEKNITIDKLDDLKGNIATIYVKTSYPPGDRLGFTVFGVAFHSKVVSLQKNIAGGYIVKIKINTLKKKHIGRI